MRMVKFRLSTFFDLKTELRVKAMFHNFAESGDKRGENENNRVVEFRQLGKLILGRLHKKEAILFGFFTKAS